MSQRFVVFLHSSRYDRVYQAASMMLTAASMGRECYLFLFYDALSVFVDGTCDDVASITRQAPDEPWAKTLERNFELSDTPPITTILDKARNETGGLKIYACSTSTRMLGLEPAQVKQKADEIVGLATMLEISADTSQVFYL